MILPDTPESNKLIKTLEVALRFAMIEHIYKTHWAKLDTRDVRVAEVLQDIVKEIKDLGGKP